MPKKVYSENRNQSPAVDWHDGQFAHGEHARFARRAAPRCAAIVNAARPLDILCNVLVQPSIFMSGTIALMVAMSVFDGPEPTGDDVDMR
jgi:hypothetical protein